ncbi:GNAT family N-acetyltransferase [Desulfotomaculum defluvii]
MANIREMNIGDRVPVIDILNHYIEHGYAAYPEKKLTYAIFEELFLKNEFYPRIVVELQEGNVVGFAMLRPYSPIPTFKKTAEISYFIKPDLLGQGLGTSMLKFLLEKAKGKGIINILANISSFNKGSIEFHRTHGFEECGMFKEIGFKNGVNFDVVWMQLKLPGGNYENN